MRMACAFSLALVVALIGASGAAAADGATANALEWIRGEIARTRPAYDANAVSNAADFAVWRGRMRTKLVELLKLSGRYGVDFKLTAELPREGYVLRKYEFSARPRLVTEMWMLVPDAAKDAPEGTVPAVVCVPGTNASLASLAGEPDGQFNRYPLRNRQAYYYVKAGFVAIALENFAAGPASGGLVLDRYVERAEVIGGSLYGVSTDCLLCCVDFLKRQTFVDRRKIAASGMSLGCFPVKYAAVASDDIAAVVYNDFVCSWAARCFLTNGSYPWKSRDMPGHYRWFDDCPDILAAIAPRPLFLVEDGHGYDCVDKIRRIYGLAGAAEAFRMRRSQKYERDEARPHDGEDFMKLKGGLSEDEFLRRCNCDPSQHSFHPDVVIPWLCGKFGLRSDFTGRYAAELEAATKEHEHFR